MIMWALVYANGTVFTNEHGEPWEAPRDMVQFSVFRDARLGWGYSESGLGVWGWRGDLGYFHGFENADGVATYDRNYRPWPLKVFGWEVSDEAFARLRSMVTELLGEERTARRDGERRL